MSHSAPFDVFISYRRESGSPNARLLREALEKRGYRVFLDVEDLTQGHFDEALLREIERIPNFLVVLSPGCLDRCVHEGDWLRLEIAHAIRTERKIVPVTLPGFVFPEVSALPEELRALPRHQAVEHTHRYFEASMDQLSAYLGKPTGPIRSMWRGRMVALTVGAAVLLAVAFGAGIAVRGRPVAHEVRLAAADAALLRSLANDMCAQLVQVNGALGDVKRIRQQATALFGSPSPSAGDLQELIRLCHFQIQQLDKTVVPPLWKNDRQAELERLGIPAEEVYAYYAAGLQPFWTDLRDFYANTARWADGLQPPNRPVGVEARYTELTAECLQCSAQLMHYGLLGLLNGFPPERRGEFLRFRSQWTNLPDSGLLSKEESDSLTEKMVQRIQEISAETAELVGNLQSKLHQAERDLEATERGQQGRNP